MKIEIVSLMPSKLKIIARYIVNLRNIPYDFLQIFLGLKLRPKFISIEITNICQCNCIFCPYGLSRDKKTIMSEELLVKILNEVKKIGIKNINLTPLIGDILIDSGIIKKLNIISSFNFESIHVFTNLVNLNKLDVNSFLESGLTSLSISTAPLEKGLYEKIYRIKKYNVFLENLVSLLENFNRNKNKTIKKIQLAFRSNIDIGDCIKTKDFKKYIKPLLTKDISIYYRRDFDSWMGTIRQDDLLEGMILNPDFKKYFPCSFLSNIQITPNGDMRLCGCRFNVNSDSDPFFIGNIQDFNIIDAYNSSTVKNLKKKFFKFNAPIECQKCSMYL